MSRQRGGLLRCLGSHVIWKECRCNLWSREKWRVRCWTFHETTKGKGWDHPCRDCWGEGCLNQSPEIECSLIIIRVFIGRKSWIGIESKESPKSWPTKPTESTDLRLLITGIVQDFSSWHQKSNHQATKGHCRRGQKWTITAWSYCSWIPGPL